MPKRLTLTVGAVLATAFVISLGITSLASIWDFVASGSWSWEGFFGFGAIIFVLAIIGGVIFGLPAFELAQGANLIETAPRMALFGALVGAFAGAIIALFFFEFRLGMLTAALPLFGGLGAASGMIAGPIWYWFNRRLERMSVEKA